MKSKKKWVPEIGGKYWRVDVYRRFLDLRLLVIKSIRTSRDENQYKIGVFKTKNQATKALKRLKRF